MVVFESGQGGTPLSEFLIINTALVCPALRRSGSVPQPLTHLILPRTGPMPLLLGFLASLGVLWRARAEKGHHVPFQPGQKVLVDGKAVRTFVGCRLDFGRMHVGLETTYRDRGQELRSIAWWPIEEIHRLVPADAKRVTRGRIAASAGKAESLGALDYLFLSAEPVTIPPDFPQIVVSSPARLSKETAESVSLFGQSLCDAVPMGNLTLAGEISHWSSKFGTSRPAVLVIPDLDRACEYVEESGDQVLLTIVDATGHNAGRTAALARLHGLGARVLVVSSQADAAESLADDTNSKIWEWNNEDINSLVAEPSDNGCVDGPVRGYEKEVVRALTAKIEVVQVHSVGVAEAFRAATVLKEAVEVRDKEVPPALENALDLTFMILTRLLRCPFQLDDHPRLLSYIGTRLDSVAQCKVATAFLTSQETNAIANVECRLKELCEFFRRRNPKADILASLRAAAKKVTLVCGDTELLNTVDGLTVNSITTALDVRGCEPDTQYAVAGWFGRGQMTRLLRPPFASPLCLILHDLEADWYRLFARRVQKDAIDRRGKASRFQLFPGVAGWKEPAVEPQDTGIKQTDTVGDDPLDEVHIRLMAGHRSRLTSLARPSAGDTVVDQTTSPAAFCSCTSSAYSPWAEVQRMKKLRGYAPGKFRVQ
jgi:GGDEF domain-containing protein